MIPAPEYFVLLGKWLIFTRASLCMKKPACFAGIPLIMADE
jgi:hypothetical protein